MVLVLVLVWVPRRHLRAATTITIEVKKNQNSPKREDGGDRVRYGVTDGCLDG